MVFKKGNKLGRGRPKGRPNKFTFSAKQAFQLAFDKMGGTDALAKWGKKNPTPFYRIYGRLIPVDVTSGGEPITAIEVTIVKAQD